MRIAKVRPAQIQYPKASLIVSLKMECYCAIIGFIVIGYIIGNSFSTYHAPIIIKKNDSYKGTVY